jgi:hypothetical protein
MTAAPQKELLKRHGINYVDTKKGTYTTACPNCNGGYLKVKTDRNGATWFCHGCNWSGPNSREHNGDGSDLGPIKAVYDYTDEAGGRLFQVLKFEPLNAPKTFRQRTGPDQKKWSIKGVRIVPYRLPELIEDIANERVVFITEGEKDVSTLRQHGVPATCSPMGAGKWRAEFNQIFEDGDVVICGDNDQPGRDHVKLVAENLRGVVRRLRVLDLVKFWPEIEESDDITDWFESGGTIERLWEIFEQLSELTRIGNGRDEPPPRRETPAAEGVSLADFYAYMPMHAYIFAPSREIWPAGSVNARIPQIPLVDAMGQRVMRRLPRARRPPYSSLFLTYV